MKLFQYPFFLAIFIGFSIFITDKIFLIPSIKKISIYYKKVEIFFFESRFELFSFFKKNEKNDYALILGSSRSGMFSNQDIQEMIPFTINIYNFSAPLAGTAYYYYWIHRFLLDKEIPKKPKFIIMELDAINLGEPSLTNSLPFSYDLPFIFEYLDFYRNLPNQISNKQLKSFINYLFSSREREKGFYADEVDSYLIRFFFIIGKYNIHPLKILENFKKIDFLNIENHHTEKIFVYQFVHKMKEKHIQSFHETHGGIPIEFYTKIPEEQLPIDAKKTFLRIFPKPELSTTQLIFLKNILEICKKYQIPLILYKPPMTTYANEILTQYNLYHLEDIINIFFYYKNVFYVDASNLNCKEFIDSVHLSPECYKHLTKYIFTEVIKQSSILY